MRRVVIAVFLVVLLLVSAASPSLAQAVFDAPGIGRAIAAQERHSDRMLLTEGVVGTAVGRTAGGEPAVLIFTREAAVPGLPRALDGVPVVVRATGAFFALTHKPRHNPPGGGGGGDGGGEAVDPTARFGRPVPIGVSTGNVQSCSAGTIGARVTDGTEVYALSNNHVYALEGLADIGTDVVQPGRLDSNCSDGSGDIIGTLHAFVPIEFSNTASNRVDAAIALSSVNDLGTATPSDGYGVPSSISMAPELGMPVQKYGRSTSLTRGEITGINATLLVGYDSGIARFIGQIIVESNKPILKAGDSGSLLVSDDGVNSPVGLLFAGNRSGKFAVANDISAVFDELWAESSIDLTIDDRPSSP